jgi:hypothetical protein
LVTLGQALLHLMLLLLQPFVQASMHGCGCRAWWVLAGQDLLLLLQQLALPASWPSVRHQ